MKQTTEAQKTLESTLEYWMLWGLESPTSKVLELELGEGWSKSKRQIPFRTFIKRLDKGEEIIAACKPAAHIIAGDFDSEDGIKQAREAKETLESAGIICIIVESGGLGHAHLFGIAKEPQLRKKARGILQSYGKGVDRSDSPIRLPGTCNRNGKRSEVTEGDITEFQRGLRACQTTYNPSKGKDQTNSAHAHHQLRQMLWAGYGLSDILNTIENDTSVQGREWFDRRRSIRSDIINELTKILAGDDHYEPLRTFAKPTVHLTPERADITEWVSCVLNAHRGQNAQQRNALSDIAQIASRTPGAEFYLSTRTLAELLNCDRRTATRYLKRFIELGYLKRVKNAAGTQATLYSLQKPHFCTTKREPSGVCSDYMWRKFADFERTPEFKDTFLRKPKPKEVYLCLVRDGATSTKDIMEMTGHSRDSVERAVKQLIQFRLVTREGHRLSVSPDPDFKAIAEERGTYGRAERRRTDHRLEREERTLKLEVLAFERELKEIRDQREDREFVKQNWATWPEMQTPAPHTQPDEIEREADRAAAATPAACESESVERVTKPTVKRPRRAPVAEFMDDVAKALIRANLSPPMVGAAAP